MFRLFWQQNSANICLIITVIASPRWKGSHLCRDLRRLAGNRQEFETGHYKSHAGKKLLKGSQNPPRDQVKKHYDLNQARPYTSQKKIQIPLDDQAEKPSHPAGFFVR